MLWSIFVYWILAERVTRPFAVHFPSDCATVRDLLGRSPQWIRRPAAAPEELDADDVWRRLHGIVMLKLDAKPEDITPDADFFDDLRAG